MNFSFEGVKILLVDDNKLNQIFAQRLLQKVLASVTLSDNGKNAVELLQKQTFDIVLLDLQMPEIDGFDVINIIRNDSSILQKDIYVIAISADVFAETRQKALEAGMNDFIAKPFEKEELYGKIETFVKLRKK